MAQRLRLIFPYRRFKTYDQALMHFRQNWRSDDGRAYHECVENSEWPRQLLLTPDTAVFDGTTWLLMISLQKQKTKQEAEEEERARTGAIMAERIWGQVNRPGTKYVAFEKLNSVGCTSERNTVVAS